MVWITGRRWHIQANLITSGYRGAQHNPLSTAERGGGVVFGFAGFGFVFGIFCCVCEFGNGEDGRGMTTRITPGVGANLLGQHAAERNQDATAYVGNLDSQVLLFLKLCFVCRHLRLMLWLTFYFWHCKFWQKYIDLSQALSSSFL